MPETLPVHNGNNHWRNLIFKDNGVGSQSRLINPYSAKTVQCSMNAGGHRPSSPPIKFHPIKYPPGQTWAVGGGRGGGGAGTQKALLHLITRDSPRQHDKNKRNTYSCVVFLSTTSYTGGGHISRTVERSSLLFVTSARRANVGAARRGKGLRKRLMTVPL